MIGEIRRFTDQVKNFFFWGWKLRSNWDWDGAYIYDIMYLKLERVHQYAVNEELHCWTDSGTNTMRKLAEAKGLCKQLKEERFHKYAHKISVKYQYDDDGDLLNNALGLHYPNAKTIDKKLYVFLMRGAIKRDSVQEQLKTDRFWYLMNKYTRHWWC